MPSTGIMALAASLLWLASHIRRLLRQLLFPVEFQLSSYLVVCIPQRFCNLIIRIDTDACNTMARAQLLVRYAPLTHLLLCAEKATASSAEAGMHRFDCMHWVILIRNVA